MAARAESVRFSRMTDGCLRRDRDAGPNQCVETRNAIEDGGDVVRRDAFRAVLTGPPHHLPPGRCFAFTGDIAVAPYVFFQTRQVSVAIAATGGIPITSPENGIYIGCEVLFDGFDWGPVVSGNAIAGAGNAEHRYLRVDYWNGSAWSPLDAIVDTTERMLPDTNGNLVRQTLRCSGRVSWHRSQMTDWATMTPTGTTRGPVYVVRLSVMGEVIVALGGAPERRCLSGTGTLTLAAPGIRPFLLEPVRSIIPYRSKTGRNTVLMGADRRELRAMESGANLAAMKNLREKPDLLRVLEDEGACVIGVVNKPGVYRSAPGTAWSPGTWTLHAAAAGSEGTANGITKFAQNYAWIPGFNGQFRGAVVIRDVSPNALGANTTWDSTFGFNISGSLSRLRANQLEGLRIYCTGGGNAGQEREVKSNTAVAIGAVTIVADPPFLAVPNVGDTYDIFRPSSRLRFMRPDPLGGTEREHEISGVSSADVAVITLETYESAIATEDNNRYGHFEIGKAMNWSIPAGRFWSGAYNSTSKKVLLANGQTGLLEYDGDSLRKVEPLDDPENVRVQQWIGSLPEANGNLLSNRALTTAYLRTKVPTCQFVVDFLGRTVVADRRRVYWSAPAPDRDIWPAMYETEIADAENHDISGMTVMGRQLIVFTPTSIHVASPPGDDGIFVFRTAVRGVGTISHRAAVFIGEGEMIFPAADGVYLFNGLTSEQVLFEWSDLVEGGINTSQLHDAAGAYSAADNRYYLAIPGDELVLVLDVKTRAWWIWDAPWGGITEIATDLDENGIETVWFGSADGHLAVLAHAMTDDGAAIEGYVRSPTLYPGGLETVQPTAVQVMMTELGEDPQVDIIVRVNGLGDTSTESVAFTQPVSATGVRAPAGELDTMFPNTDILGHRGRMVTEKVGIPAYETGEGIQLEVRGSTHWRLRAAALLLGATSPVQRSPRQ